MNTDKAAADTTIEADDKQGQDHHFRTRSTALQHIRTLSGPACRRRQRRLVTPAESIVSGHSTGGSHHRKVERGLVLDAEVGLCDSGLADLTGIWQSCVRQLL